MIPKIAHFYWGNNQLPFLRYLSLWSFCRNNPDWTVKLHVPTDVSTSITWKTDEQKYEIKNNDYYAYVKNLPVKIVRTSMLKYGFSNSIPEVHKSDIIRWNVLFEQGGLWSDMDIFYIKSVKNCIDASSDKDYLCFSTKKGYYSIGFMFSRHRSEIMRRIATECRKNYSRSRYQCVGSVLMKKVLGNITNVSKQAINLNMNVVYPFDSYHVQELWGNTSTELPEETVGIHWYAGNRLSGEYTEKIQESNLKTFNNNMTRIIDTHYS